jgi:pyruvate carboxylase subunit B
MKYYVEIEGRSFEVEIGPEGMSVDGQPVAADLQANHDSHLWHLVLDGRSHTLRARRRDGRGDWEMEIDGRRHRVRALDERQRAIRELAGTAAVSHGPIEETAPMPGLVLKVEVSEGEPVERGQGIIIIEAMKMENELKASSTGRVTDIRVAAGQAVDKGQTLLVIEPAGDGDC